MRRIDQDGFVFEFFVFKKVFFFVFEKGEGVREPNDQIQSFDVSGSCRVM